jgi:uncharacterized integral membrane protein (TIGR00698 family)
VTNQHAGSRPFNFLPGLGLATVIATVAHIFSLGHPALDPLVISVLISIVLGNLLAASPRLEPGAALARRIFIPIGIVLYGTQMDLRPLRTFGPGRIVHIFLMVFTALIAISWIAARLGIPRKLGLLLAAGSAICGASAIMVLSPVIKAEKEDTSVSILAITVVGLIGVVLYPLAQEMLTLSNDVYALLCGSTLNQMGQVRAAAALIGQNVLEIAVPVKLLRIGTLFPIAIAYSYLAGNYRGKVYVPWFIVGSAVVALVCNLAAPAQFLRTAATPFVMFFFSIGISGVGLSVNIESLIDVGPKPLVAAFLGWLILIFLFIVGLKLIG